MKFVFIATVALLAASSAFAECDMGSCDGLGSTLFSTTMAPFLTSMAPSVSAVAQNREAYVNGMREDAAEFVAADGKGVAGVALRDAMDQVREKVPGANQASDIEIAKFIFDKIN